MMMSGNQTIYPDDYSINNNITTKYKPNVDILKLVSKYLHSPRLFVVDIVL